jgi:glycosyltransferase involved in cell wall biosynthesis
LYTDNSFKNTVKGKSYIYGHCPYHKSKKGLFLFLIGLIPEWRGYYSKLWKFFFLRKKYDLIYAFFYSIDLAKFACWIATQKKADLIVHIADHSASFINNLEFISILNQSSKLCCIGNNMKDYYETFFNKTFDVFHNLADDSYLPLSKTTNSSFNESNPLKILFIGSLFKTLHDGTINIFCRAIDELNEQGYSITFNVYGQLVPNCFLEKEFSSPNIMHHGIIPPEGRFRIMSQNHSFLVPSSFSNNTKKEYCYSIPTKLPELLLSSRPVIVLGPKEMEAFRFCNENNCGILIDENSIEAIKSKIIDLHLNFSRYNDDSMKTSHKLFSQLSISSQGNNFQNFVLN